MDHRHKLTIIITTYPRKGTETREMPSRIAYITITTSPRKGTVTLYTVWMEVSDIVDYNLSPQGDGNV